MFLEGHCENAYVFILLDEIIQETRRCFFLCFLTNTQERRNSANLDVFPTNTMNACLFPVQNKGYACLFPSLERESMETRMCKFCVSLCFLKRSKIQNHIDAST